jgi:hypothetical protein
LLLWHLRLCFGQLALWGKCIEHTKGWRAQYAYPLRLWIVKKKPYWSDERAKLLEEAYGVPVKGLILD